MRSNLFSDIDRQFDIIIIGGGIYGATLLWEASLRGIKAILVEQNDFGSGTSANSLKIIHGGLRYLKRLDFKRVRDSAAEQNCLLHLAPHNIKQLACLTPTYRSVTESLGLFKMAFVLYSLLCADIHKKNKTRILPSGRCISALKCQSLIDFAPLDGISGGAMWHDALALNTERLVFSFIQSAQHKGAVAMNYVKMHRLITRNGRVVGIEAQDVISGNSFDLLGRLVVNCSGPWTKTLTNWHNPGQIFDKLAFVKAVNIVVPYKMCDLAVGLKVAESRSDSFSKRLMFFVPWRDATMIGTWYFDSKADDRQLGLKSYEIDCILRDIRESCPDLKFDTDQISFVHQGWLPVHRKNGKKNDSRLFNHCQIYDHHKMGGLSNLYSVIGVKYTTARSVAQRILKIISNNLGGNFPIEFNGKRLLYDANYTSLDSFKNDMIRKYHTYFPLKTIIRIIGNYGSEADKIFTLAQGEAALRKSIAGADNFIKAEVVHILEEELVCTLPDLLLRRAGVGSEQKPKNETIEDCANVMANHFKWSSEKKKKEIDCFLETYSWMRK